MLFDSTTRDCNVAIDQFMKVMFLLKYIQKWRLELWELVFYQEFKVKGGIAQGKTWELQIRANEALKCMLYKWKIMCIHE